MKKEIIFRTNIDKLEIAYQATELNKTFLESLNDQVFDDGAMSLIRKESKEYKNEFAIWGKDYNEEKGLFDVLIGYLYFGSYNPNRNHIYVSYTNEALYTQWLIDTRYYIEEALKLQFAYITKLEIALDTNFSIRQHILKAYKDLSYEVIVNNEVANDENVKGVGAYATDNPRLSPFRNPELIVFNKDKSMSFKCYNKKKEIKDSHKYYISKDFDSKIMYRIEVTLKNHRQITKCLSILGLNDTDLYVALRNEDKLQALFVTALNKLIRLRKNRKCYNLIEVAIDKFYGN